MSESSNQKVKRSFIAGSLTSSAGIFVSKAIGLFYITPFTALASQENKVYYTSAYNYYNVLLQICSAGLPFAIAAIVAKYAEKDDYKTVLLVRKLSTGMLGVFGFLMMMLFAVFSGPLAADSLGAGASAQSLEYMQTSFRILSLALFLVPLLYSYRGFYQGLKDLKTYADSQVIEQFTRVFSLLGLGWICVHVLHLDRIWAVYMGVAATSIAAIVALLYYIRYDRRQIGAIRRKAREQEAEPMDHKLLMKELLAFGLPYLISSIFGNSQSLINTRFMIPTLTGFGMSQKDAQLLYSIVQLDCDKLTSIPQVLSIGFSAGIVPYMTVSFENKDWKGLQKNIQACLDTVCYIALPVCFTMFALAEPIYYIMYGSTNMEYARVSLEWSALLALCTTLTPICSTMMMTLHLRKESIFYLFAGFVVKCAAFYPLIKYTGYTGAITSSILCSLCIIYLSLAKISNKYHVRYKRSIVRFFKMIIACLCMNGGYAALKFAGLAIPETSRILALLWLMVYGIVGMSIYFFAAERMKLTKAVFHASLKTLIRRYLRRKEK